ncbi:hypothetical protein [Rhodoblastus sp.]|uniref:hypothetical protein n=1 Tax=Rhodoblastus sp. TaxID=1962975 RepID=UPI003F961B89
MSVASKKISKRNVPTPKVHSHVCVHDNQKAPAIPPGQAPVLDPGQLPPETIRLGADRDRVRNQTIQAAEEIISPAPSWLPDVLAELSFELPSAHSIEEIWPTREKVREELLEFHRLVDLLSERLQNSAVTGFMAANTDADTPAVLSNIAQNHRELRALVRRALKSPQLVGENGELLRGRGKPLLSNTMSPRYICAAIIVEVSDFFYPEKVWATVAAKRLVRGRQAVECLVQAGPNGVRQTGPLESAFRGSRRSASSALAQLHSAGS